MMIDNSLLAAFMLGLLGGVHCAAMCGGIVCALSLAVSNQRTSVAVSPVRWHARAASVAGAGGGGSVSATMQTAGTTLAPASHWSAMWLFNSGRILMYGLLGLLAGAVGSLSWLLQDWLPVQQIAYGVTSVMLVLIGIYVAGFKHIAALAERTGSHLWRRVQPLASNLIQRPGAARRLLAGGLWGLIPCGMVYGVLMVATATASPVNGAALMLAFGLGTLPNLLLMGAGGARLMRWRQLPAFRWAAGALIAGFGLVGLLRLDIVSASPIVQSLCLTPF